MGSLHARHFAMAFTLCLVSTSLAPGQELLRWQFQQGGHYKLTLGQQTRYVWAGQTLEIDTTVSFDWRVESIDPEGIATIAITTERYRMSYDGPLVEQVTHYDSAIDEEVTTPCDPWLGQLYKTVGAPFRIEMDPRGEIRRIVLSQEFLATAGNTRRSLRKVLETGMPLFPEEAVAQGDTWQLSWPRPWVTSAVQIDSEFVYNGQAPQEEPSAPTIEMAFVFRAIPPSTGQDAEPSSEANIVSQAGSGCVSFDNEAGRLLSSTHHTAYTLRWDGETSSIRESLERDTHWTLSPVADP